MGCAMSSEEPAASFPPSRQQFPSPCHSPQHQPYSPQAHPQRPPPAPRPVRMFSYSELETATYGFAESRRLGGGGFGQVYKGFLDGGQDAVAVKLLDAGGQQGEEEFNAEVALLRELQHSHLIPLKGICRDGAHRAIVTPLLTGGSLRGALDLGRSEAEQAGPAVSHRSPLTWTARLHVAADAASALAYVHQAGWVHADCSSGNLMLTLTNDAQLCDFGLSRRAQSPDCGTPTARVQRRAGELATNYAYCAPELHLPQGELTARSDTYAFGIVLLELLTGREPGQSLVDDLLPVLDSASQEQLEACLDAQLDRRRVGAAPLLLFAEVALGCLRPDPKDRLPMREVHRHLAAACRHPAPSLPAASASAQTPPAPALPSSPAAQPPLLDLSPEVNPFEDPQLPGTC